jgi:hypothetical protein
VIATFLAAMDTVIQFKPFCETHRDRLWIERRINRTAYHY